MTNKSIRDYINLIKNLQREGVAEGSENFTITQKKDHSYPGSLQVVITDKSTGKQKVIAGDPRKIKQQIKQEFGIDYNFGQQGVAEEQLEETSPEAIAKVEPPAAPVQEPVAWGVFEGNLHDLFLTQAEAQEMAALKGSHAKVRPLYAASPQPRQWVGLTDEDAQIAALKVPLKDRIAFDAGMSAAAKILKEKNT